MASIYDLDQAWAENESRIFMLNEHSDEDADEYAALMRKREEILCSAEDNLEWKLERLSDMKSYAAQVEERKKRIVARSKRADTEVERMKAHIMEHMQKYGVQKLKGVEFSVSLGYAGGGSVAIPDGYNLRELPESCYKVVPEQTVPDKREITKLFADIEWTQLDGKQIKEMGDGLLLVREESLKFS